MKHFRWRSVEWFGVLFLLALMLAGGIQQASLTRAQEGPRRDIISEDFLKHRPRSRRGRVKRSTYRAATVRTKPLDQSRLQVGVTIWKLEPVTAGSSTGLDSIYAGDRNKLEWIPRRVEADAKFREGDFVRLSIELPRPGYLYVIDRDCLADGSFGDTNLIFPTAGEDNRLRAGKLIDLPAQRDVPFKATPKANQTGELLTFIVTTTPLSLPLSKNPLPVSKTQLTQWEEKWSAEADRFEMNGGAGQTRTIEEQLAASPDQARQLTRADPLPQTVYSLVPKNRNAVLFNVTLSYLR